MMTTRPQRDLPLDPAVLRTVARTNNTNAGVYLEPDGPGTLHVDDEVVVSADRV